MAATDHVYTLRTYRGQITNSRYTPRICTSLDRVVNFIDYTADENVPDMDMITAKINESIDLMELECERLNVFIEERIAAGNPAWEIYYSNEMTFEWWTATEAGGRWIQALLTLDWLCTYIEESHWHGLYDVIEANEQALFYMGKLKDLWRMINDVVQTMSKDTGYLEYLAEIEVGNAAEA